MRSQEYYYINEEGKRTEIPYLWPETLSHKGESDKSVDLTSNKIYAFHSEMGRGADDNGKNIKFRVWVIGPVSKKDSLLEEKDRFVTRELTGIDFLEGERIKFYVFMMLWGIS